MVKIRRALPQMAILAATSLPEVAAQLDQGSLSSKYFGNDAAWYQTKIPFFECSDSKIQDVYYYRWKIFRAHQRDLGARGYISTEFLDDVSWQLSPWASLNDATGFHLGEGRWLRDRRYADDYLRHMYLGGGNDRHFTDYMADSAWGRYLVDGDASAVTPFLDSMVTIYRQWNDRFDSSKGLYWVEPIADATEYTISSIDASGGQDGFFGGNAFRPTINSYMWANALAISNIANLTGNSSVASEFKQKAATLRSRFTADIWNTTLEHFIDRYQVDNQYVKYYTPIRGRELAGYVPWMFSMPDNSAKFNAAWKHLRDTNKFKGVNGMRTNEPSYQYYMRQYRYEGSRRECQWNGPVWPYQTTQVLLGMANLLATYSQTILTRSDYLAELRTYTNLHYLNGVLDLQEDYEPDKVGVIVGLDRSHHYFHSGYNDLIITGFVGIRPRADNVLEVNPMVPQGGDISYFRLQDINYHGHVIAVEWDVDGSRYNRGKGLRVYVDGQQAASATTLTRVTAALTKAAAPAIQRVNITQSVQLYTDQYPKGSASSNNDNSARVHDAIDGRVWFFPELPNGWDSAATSADSQQWYTIDFGKTVSLTGCELAFYADSNFAVPQWYDIQKLVNGAWVKIWGYGEPVIGNGITHVQWDRVDTTQLRVLFGQPANKQTRLVEFKAW